MTNYDETHVAVTLKTVISDGEDQQTTTMTAEGKLYRKNESLFLQFHEETEDLGFVNQVVKIDDHHQSVTILRHGTVSMRQQFLNGKRTEGVYKSSYGTMLMDTQTKHIRLHIDEKKSIGTVQLSYQLHMQQEFVGDYQITINFRGINR